MSELHPSAPKLTKGRRNHRLRQVADHWPLLIWLFVLCVAIYGYSKGNVFTRMNGVVDVYQESIAPTEDGTFLRLEEGIETGKTVEEGDVIAYMDPTMVDLEIGRFKERRRERGRDSAEKAHERVGKLRDDQLDVDLDISQLDVRLKGAAAQLEALKNAPPAARARKAEIELDVTMLNLERESLVARKKHLETLVAEREKILAEIREGKETEILMNAEDQKQLAMMELKREWTILKARKKGKIDRIMKEPGEFVEAGESIVKIVAEAEQILGFLPQQEVGSVKVGDTVWVTSAVDRFTTFKSKVLSLSPRIDSVRDAASPLPNQAVRGRTILIEYPSGSGFLPGQPIIIHLQPPGELSLLSKFFNLFK